MKKYLELFKNKEKIDLNRKKIDDKKVFLICEVLSKNRTLKELILFRNNIGDEGAKVLAKNTTLRELDLSWNNIGDEGAKALAKNTTLRELDISWNKISDEGVKALSKNRTLIKLDLIWNDISDELLNKTKINIQNNKKRQKLTILTTKILIKNNVIIPDYYPRILFKY